MSIELLKILSLGGAILFLSPVPRFAYADEPAPVVQTEQKHTLYLGLGVLSHSLGKYATSPSGGTQFLGPLFPTVVIQYHWNFKDSDYALCPSLTFTPLGLRSSDGTYQTYLFPFTVSALRHFQNFEVRAGLGLFLSRLSGSGGVSIQNNGTSTSVYLNPDSSSTMAVLSLNLGAGYRFKNFLGLLEGIMSTPLTSRRAFDLMLSVQYGLL